MSWERRNKKDPYAYGVRVPMCDRCRLLKPTSGPLRLNQGWWHITPYGGDYVNLAKDIHFCPNCAQHLLVTVDAALASSGVTPGPEPIGPDTSRTMLVFALARAENDIAMLRAELERLRRAEMKQARKTLRKPRKPISKEAEELGAPSDVESALFAEALGAMK